jgi:hypothetical protein
MTLALSEPGVRNDPVDYFFNLTGTCLQSVKKPIGSFPGGANSKLFLEAVPFGFQEDRQVVDSVLGKHPRGANQDP